MASPIRYNPLVQATFSAQLNRYFHTITILDHAILLIVPVTPPAVSKKPLRLSGCFYPRAFLIVLLLSTGVDAAHGQPDPRSELDNAVLQAAAQAGLDNTLADDVNIPDISDPLAQLGKMLFFSRSLSGDFDVACASCHHPFLAGGDSLSLPVGTGANDPYLIGPGRVHAASRMQDPRANGAPNVARHSPTTFNSVLYRRALFHDGRVFLQGNAGAERSTRTPDSLMNNADPDAGEDLLGAQSRFPIAAGEEMRGPVFEKNSPNEQVRAHIAGRLGNYDLGLGELVGVSWIEPFRKGFNAPTASAREIVTFANIMKALSAYQSSQVFIDTPWSHFLDGDSAAISSEAKKGALLFLQPKSRGGAGCASCHRGDFFTDESYHNLAVPQIGRGQRQDGSDRGRYEISKQKEDKFAFRTPALLNVAASAPYTHAGAFDSLEDVIRHHLDPAKSIANYDFTLASLAQFAGSNFSYPNARQNTLTALVAYKAGNERLSEASLSDTDVQNLVAFLHTLTDPCVLDAQCLSPWVGPGKSPDGKSLQARFGGFANDPATWVSAYHDPTSRAVAPPSDELPEKDYRAQISMTLPTVPVPATATAAANGAFTDVTARLGLDYPFEWDMDSLLDGAEGVFNKLSYYNPSQHFGGVAAGDYDRDGFLDLYLTRGNSQGNLLLRNLGNGRFEDMTAGSGTAAHGHMSAGAKFVDIDGDSWLDLLLSGHRTSGMRLFRNDRQGGFNDVTASSGLESTRNSYSTAFSDFDRDGDLDLAVGRWSVNSGEDSHLYINDGAGEFTPADQTLGFLVARFSNFDMSFTPNFADLDKDNWDDLLFANDFKTSQVLRNIGGGVFRDVTDRQVITDENAMGAAVGDYDNDGDEDWFVTSIHDELGNDSRGRWFASGNKLYRNDDGQLKDVSAEAGITIGGWGWGACFIDVDNDGNLDIFHVNGFGNHSDETIASFGVPGLEKTYLDFRHFADTPARLFTADGDGTFTESSQQYSLDIVSEGRGLSCLDYDRDGDLDIFIANNQQPPKLLRNNLNLANGNHFISLRLSQPGGNSQAIGSRVVVTAGGRRYYQQLKLGSNYLSHNPAELHFGLGKAQSVEKLEIIWPGGSPTTVYKGLPVNRHFHVRRVPIAP